MTRHVPNLNWVRSFEASARHLSFTEASRELNMTQSGISQHVRSLELHLRQPLFHRLPRGVQLTDAGEAYLHVIRESFDLLSAGTREIFGESDSSFVTVRINVAFATQWLASRLPRYQRLYPDSSLRLLATVHGLDTVWDGVDFEIRYGDSHFAGLAAEPLMTDRLSPVCHPAIAQRLGAPSDLLAEHLLHVIGNSHGWSEWFQAAGVTGRICGPATQTDTSAIALELAEQAAGIALGHSSLIGEKANFGILVQPFPTTIETEGVFFLVMPTGREMRPQARLFRDWLLDEGRKAPEEV